MKTKNILLFVVTIVYFFISYDVVDLPYHYEKTYKDMGYIHKHHWNETYNGTFQENGKFHSKLFGDISFVPGWTDDLEHPYNITEEFTLIKSDMWILHLINWYKAILISLLYCSLFLSKFKRKNEELFFFYFAPGVIWSICTLCDLSPSYGFSEILIVILLAINFMPKSNKN